MQETKGYCGRYCGRGQLLAMLGGRFGLSRRRDIPGRMKSRTFRYGFWLLFFAMFFLALWNTCLMFAGLQDLRQVVTLLRTFKLPWQWAYHGTQFHPGFWYMPRIVLDIYQKLLYTGLDRAEGLRSGR